jgi:hypothetical protein
LKTLELLGKLFRRLFLTRLLQLYDGGKLTFFGLVTHLADRPPFLRHLSAVRKRRWVVYAKPPFAGPEAVLAYLSRYTHRVAISNSRSISFDETGVTFHFKNYRRDGSDRQQVMTLAPDEFIRASCFTSCRAASTASGITVCSPAVPERLASPAPANS